MVFHPQLDYMVLKLKDGNRLGTSQGHTSTCHLHHRFLFLGLVDMRLIILIHLRILDSLSEYIRKDVMALSIWGNWIVHIHLGRKEYG